MKVYILSFADKYELRAFYDKETAVKALMKAWCDDWINGQQTFDEFFEGMTEVLQDYGSNCDRVGIEDFGQVEMVEMEN